MSDITMSDINQIADNVRRMKALFDAIQMLDSQATGMADKTYTELAAYGFELANDTEKALND